jgi:HlyD family secretion protein
VKLGWKWIAALGVLAVAVLVAALTQRHSSVQYLAAKAQRGDIRDVVETTGTVAAVTTVLVGSQVSGTIAKLNVDFNSRVSRGDVVALIDPAALQGALYQATADLESARANVAVVEANLEKAHATVVQTKADFERAETLVRDKLQPQQFLDQARANYDTARAAVSGAEAAVTQSKAQVRQKEAALTVAKTNLDYTIIRSPIDGVVVARNVDVGQTVAASLQAPTIFTIAQDLTKMQLHAKTDESDVGRVSVSQAVSFKVDAFPKEVFHGTVSQVRMNATTIQNVVTYDTIIDFDNPDLKLFPGMTAYVTIPVESATDVLKLPNTALRFEPPLRAEELRALLLRFGIDPDEALNAPPLAANHAQSREARREGAVVWKLHADMTIEPIKVTLGVTDHAYTEIKDVTKGQLHVDDDVVIASVGSKSAAGPGSPR